MWWMMGETGGHYCNKKSDDICGNVCGQVWFFIFSFRQIFCLFVSFFFFLYGSGYMFGCWRKSKIWIWKIMWYAGPYRVFRVHAIVFEPFKFDLFLEWQIKELIFCNVIFDVNQFSQQPNGGLIWICGFYFVEVLCYACRHFRRGVDD
jgi:hypothetical protein